MAVAGVSFGMEVPARARAVGWLGYLGGLFLGLVLLFAAGMKALDPRAFAEEITALGLAGALPATAVALAALAVESLVGALLAANLRRLPVMIGATALVAFFLFLTGRTAWRAAHGLADSTSACGCFGNLVERTPAEAFRQDLLLLLPALALAWLGRPGTSDHPRIRAAAASGVALGIVGFAVAAPALPLDDAATRLRPGTEIASLCAGRDAERVCLAELAPELAHGTHLVVIADAAGAGFVELAKRWNEYARSGAEPPIAVLAELTPERRTELFWTVAPAFELHETPRALLRPLYRSLPRSFRLEEGRVTATWAGLPPDLAAGSGPAPDEPTTKDAAE